MAQRPRFPIVITPEQQQAMAAELSSTYEAADQRIRAILSEGNITDWRKAFLQQQRAQVQRELMRLKAANESWARAYLPTLYANGLDNVDGWLMQRVYRDEYLTLIGEGKTHWEAVEAISKRTDGMGPGGLSRPWGAHPGQVTPMDLGMTKLHGEAIEHTVRSFVTRANYALNGVARDVDDIFRTAQLAQVREAYAMGDTTAQFSKRIAQQLNEVYGAKIGSRIQELEASGMTPLRILDKLQEEGLVSGRMREGLQTHLSKVGLANDPGAMVNWYRHNAGTEFVDKLGRRWDMKRYTDMLARTTTREASDLGKWTRMYEVGLDVVEVVGHSKFPDSPCVPYEGQKLSLHGNTPGMTTLADAMATGYKHPNCIHTEVPVIEDVGAYRRDAAKLAESVPIDEVRALREKRLGVTMKEVAMGGD